MTKAASYVPLLIACALGLWLGRSCAPERPMSDAEAAIPTLAKQRDEARQKAARNARASEEAFSALADSTAAWNARLSRLSLVAEAANARHTTLLGAVRALGARGAALSDSLGAAHGAAISAERQKTATVTAENHGLRAQVAADSLLIESLYHELDAWEALDAQRQAVNAELRQHIESQDKRQTVERIIVAGGVLALLITT